MYKIKDRWFLRGSKQRCLIKSRFCFACFVKNKEISSSSFKKNLGNPIAHQVTKKNHTAPLSSFKIRESEEVNHFYLTIDTLFPWDMHVHVTMQSFNFCLSFQSLPPGRYHHWIPAGPLCEHIPDCGHWHRHLGCLLFYRRNICPYPS
jgi:hypothetical protein